MIIAKEGAKNLEAKAHFIDVRGGCGCATSSIRTTARDAICTCGCTTTSNNASAKAAGRDL